MGEGCPPPILVYSAGEFGARLTRSLALNFMTWAKAVAPVKINTQALATIAQKSASSKWPILISAADPDKPPM